MTKTRENQILFKRFAIVTLMIALGGIALAQLIAATHRSDAGVTVHNRVLDWQKFEQVKACPDQHCSIEPVSIVYSDFG